MARWFLKFASYKKKNDIFDMVKSGKKTIEDRPYNPEKARNYSKVKPGDTLVLCSLDTGEKLEKKATRVCVYKSIREMAENEPIGKIIPGVKSSEELVGLFEEFKKKWGGSYARKLEKYGIVAIGME
jgi:ASC-1-like (ASCH) protein